MRNHPLYFDKVDIALTRAGEDAGELAIALERLVARRRLAGKLSSTLLSALAYPAFLAFFGCGVILFLAGYVIPDINAMLIAGGGTVPLLTRLLQAAAWVLSVGLIPLGLLTALATAVIVRRVPKLKSSLFRVLLRLPIVGPAWMNWQLSQFCLVLRTLLASGVQLPEALGLAGEASGEGPMSAAAQRLRQRVIEGHDLGRLPKQMDSGIPPWLWRALAVGQTTGDLVEVLERVGQRFEAAALRSAARVGAVLEPLMILIVGTFVGLVAYAALMPIVKLNGLW
jgi:general secretion pathway protein F